MSYPWMVKAVGEAADKQKFVAVGADKAAKKEKEKKGEAAQHADSREPNQAVFGKVPGYAQRGHDFLKANSSAVPNRELSPSAVYKDFGRDYLEKIVDLLRKHATFPGGPARNFNPKALSATGKKAGQRFPYGWEALHMIPASAFYLKDEKDQPAFTDQQAALLMKTPYDVNHGHNIIMLPKLAWGAPVHGLLQHPSDHPEYTIRVIKDLQSLGKAVQKKVKEKKKDHKALVANFFERLKKIEDGCWDFLVDLGRSSVASACAGKEFDHPQSKHVLFKALTRPTDYQFGRLY
jgi:hypothetical protein